MMKITGIVAEYNPFHNGHQYHIEKTRELTGCDYIIAVMSGDFVQRGAPAIADKYLRAQMALSCGADLVLELPVFFAVASAEFFATGAVALLDALGCVDTLSFGAESDDRQLFWKASALLAKEDGSFSRSLREALKGGSSYPKARQQAFLNLLESNSQENHSQETAKPELLLSSPNNILGLEYCKALRMLSSTIRPLPILRSGSAYHDIQLEEGRCASATGIRRQLTSQESLSSIASHVPSPVLSVLEQNWGRCLPVMEEDFSLPVHLRLLEEQGNYEVYADFSAPLARRAGHLLVQYDSLPSFIGQLKTKNYTYTRIARSLFHLLLGITRQDAALARTLTSYAPYGRILGFRRSAAPLLSQIRRNSRIPLISKMADASNLLSSFYPTSEAEAALRLLELDVHASRIYEAVITNKFHLIQKNEYTRGVLCI